MIPSIRKNRYYRIMLWAGFTTCMLLVIWRGSKIVMNPDWLSADNFFGYWAAGNLSLHAIIPIPQIG